MALWISNLWRHNFLRNKLDRDRKQTRGILETNRLISGNNLEKLSFKLELIFLC